MKKNKFVLATGTHRITLDGLENCLYHTFAVETGLITISAEIAGHVHEVDTGVASLAMYNLLGVAAFSITVVSPAEFVLISGK